jgi:hypothetical protein
MEYGAAYANVPDKGDALRIQGVIVALVHPSYAKNGRWQRFLPTRTSIDVGLSRRTGQI